MEFTYSQPTEEEGKNFNTALEKLVEETNIQMVVKPDFMPDGRVTAVSYLMKRTPKEDGTNKETSPEETK